MFETCSTDTEISVVLVRSTKNVENFLPLIRTSLLLTKREQERGKSFEISIETTWLQKKRRLVRKRPRCTIQVSLIHLCLVFLNKLIRKSVAKQSSFTCVPFPFSFAHTLSIRHRNCDATYRSCSQ